MALPNTLEDFTQSAQTLSWFILNVSLIHFRHIPLEVSRSLSLKNIKPLQVARKSGIFVLEIKPYLIIYFRSMFLISCPREGLRSNVVEFPFVLFCLFCLSF